MLRGGRVTPTYPTTAAKRMGGGSGYADYNHSPRTTATSSMNGPVDRVYHFTEDSHEAKRVSNPLRSNGQSSKNTSSNISNKKNRYRTRSGSGGSLEYNSGESSHDTIDGSNNYRQAAPVIPPPPGLKNVGNSCYANAALQCLLATALPHALLDERNAHMIRRHSFNRKLLVHGSGSVDSESDTNNSKDSADAGSAFGSCLSGMSGIYEDENMDDDDVILARAMGGDHHDALGSSGLRGSPSRASARSRKRVARNKHNSVGLDTGHHEKGEDDGTVTSCSTLHSDMYHVMKSRQRKAEQPDSEADLLCAWLTQELTQITREYTTPRLGFKTEKRKDTRRTGGKRSPTNILGSLFKGAAGGNNPRDNLQQHRNRVVDPGSITRHVHKISPCLRPYQQEDAHEFFRALLSSLTMHGQNARLSSLFDGLLESSVTCQTCRKSSLTRDRYMDLSLDISDKSITTLEKAFEKFTEDETLCHDNMATCSRCEVKRVVTKGLRLATAPTMLAINYKRFAYDNYGRLSRLSKQVHFPLRLDISEYMSRANRGKPPPYTLVAVLVHRGRSCDCGHYFAYVRKGQDWYLANDAEVTKVDVEEVLSAQAYVLVYEVAGMKEKHNFDCYSRYHRSLDEADEESMARDRNDEHGMPSWDFSSLTSLLEACDAGLCGSIANVMETSAGANNTATDPPSAQQQGGIKIKHSLEEDIPPRKSSSKQQGNRSAKVRSPKSQHHKSFDTNDADNRSSPTPKQVTDPLSQSERVTSHTAYYKRGRSHTPSRHNRRDRPDHHRHVGGGDVSNRDRERADMSAMFDFEPPDGAKQRRAKSLSRVSVDKFKSRKVDAVTTQQPEHGTSRTSQRSSQPSRRRVPSRPRDRHGSNGSGQQVVLPPLHEQRSGSSTRGVMHNNSSG